MLNLNSIMVGTMQPKVLADFYTAVLEKPADMDEGGWFGWTLGGCYFSIGEHSEMNGPAKDPGRVIFNFETNEVTKEFDRIKSLGATVIKEPYDMGEGMLIATFADPDGNMFQLVMPWE